MTNRVFNFSAGPATLNEEVLAASAAALQNYENGGVGIAKYPIAVLNLAR